LSQVLVIGEETPGVNAAALKSSIIKFDKVIQLLYHVESELVYTGDIIFPWPAVVE
jgi:hypothetical protein